MALLVRAVLVVVVTFVAVLVGLQFKTRINIPDHLLGHKALFVPGLLSEATGAELRQILKDMKQIPTNSADLKFYKCRHHHIGELTPMVNGVCPHPYLAANVNMTGCHLPGRMDVGRHFILGGGVEGMKEPFDTMASRVQSFGSYNFDLEKYPIIGKLFQDASFQNAAKTVCPPGKSVLDPFQFNFIVQVPGQSVALHLDAPYIWGATRFQFPQWLLVAMVYSGFWKDQFIDQVQVVGYFHQWNDTKNERDGKFVYWDQNAHPPKSVPCEPLAGSAVDGSKVVHAAGIYMPKSKPPHIDKSKETTLEYVGDDAWRVVSGGEVMALYKTDDLRLTIVYRARCFTSEAERTRFNTLPDEETMQLSDILDKFRADLVAKGKWAASAPVGPEATPEAMLKFGIAILDEYVHYPLSPDALVPYNYCALDRIFPLAKPLLSLFC